MNTRMKETTMPTDEFVASFTTPPWYLREVAALVLEDVWGGDGKVKRTLHVPNNLTLLYISVWGDNHGSYFKRQSHQGKSKPFSPTWHWVNQFCLSFYFVIRPDLITFCRRSNYHSIFFLHACFEGVNRLLALGMVRFFQLHAIL